MRLSTFAFTFILPLLTLGQEQVPMQNSGSPKLHSQPSLADLLTIEPSASIFFSYARELQMSNIFSEENAGITLLVPTNKAVMALARKP